MRKVAELTLILMLLGASGCENQSHEKKNSLVSEDISSLAKQFPDSIPLQLAYQLQIFQKGNQKTSIEGLMKLAEKNPERIELLNQVAEMALQTKDTSLSIHYLNQSIKANPHNSDAAFMLAGIYAAQKNPDWKIISEQLIQKSDDPVASSRGHYLTGIQLANSNRIKEAITSFDKAIIINFTFTDAYIEKAILLLEMGQTDQAIDMLYKAQELDRKSADIPFWLGECYLNKKDEEKAKAFFEESLRLDPDYEAAFDRIDNIKH